MISHNAHSLLFVLIFTLFLAIMVNANVLPFGIENDSIVDFFIIGSSIVEIGEYKYAHNQLELDSITISSSVKTIGEAAFWINNLKSVNIPDGVTSIGRSAFCQNQLTHIVIPKSVIKIEDEVFRGNQLTNVTIGNSVTDIGMMAFYDNKLESIVIPNSVKRIRQETFVKNQLKSITIGANVVLGGTYGGPLRNRKINSFDGNFDRAYKLGGRRAGTYVKKFGWWWKQ